MLAAFGLGLFCRDNDICADIYAITVRPRYTPLRNRARHLADAGTMFARTQVVAVEAVAKFESGAAAKFEAKKAAGLAGVGAVPLTAANFDAEIAGKGAFIKFLAPW